MRKISQKRPELQSPTGVGERNGQPFAHRNAFDATKSKELTMPVNPTWRPSFLPFAHNSASQETSTPSQILREVKDSGNPSSDG